MNGVLGAILPLALAVTISPTPIIAEILLLFTKKATANAGAYLMGFVIGVGVVLGILVVVAGAINLAVGSGPSKGAATVELILGLLLGVASVSRFRRRPKPGLESPTPTWMKKIDGFTPPRSFAIGVALGALNPKNVIVGLASAVAIASPGLSAGHESVAVVVYVVIAALGVASPLVVTLALGDRSQATLQGWKAWLSQNNATVMAVLLLVYGVVLIGKGIAGL